MLKERIVSDLHQYGIISDALLMKLDVVEEDYEPVRWGDEWSWESITYTEDHKEFVQVMRQVPNIVDAQDDLSIYVYTVVPKEIKHTVYLKAPQEEQVYINAS